MRMRERAAIALAIAIAIAIASIAIASIAWMTLDADHSEAFSDQGPLAPPTFKPCEVYYTADKASCDDGTFLTSRAAYAATLAEIESKTPTSAADDVRAAAIRTAMAEMDALPGPGGACKLRLPAPWTRVVSDPDDDVYGTADGPGTMFCYLPTSGPAADASTDYAALAAPAAKVSATSGNAFAFHAPGADGPGDPATSPYRRFQFDDLRLGAFATGFACRLPAVAAARDSDARYDVGRAGWSTLMTFGVRAYGRTSLALTSAALDGDLLRVMRGFYEESVMGGDGSEGFATLVWTPHLEAGAQVLRVNLDACGKQFADTTFDDKCAVGHAVPLKTYSLNPKPAAFGTTTDIRSTKTDALEQIAKYTAALKAANAFMDKQRARYDNVLEILRRTLEAWELEQSSGLQDLVDRAASTETRRVFDTPTARPGKYEVVTAPPTAVPAKIEADDSLIDGGPRPPADRYGPGLPGPTFYIKPAAAGRSTTLGPLISFSTNKAVCPNGYHISELYLRARSAADPKVEPVLTCVNSLTNEERTVWSGSSGQDRFTPEEQWVVILYGSPRYSFNEFSVPLKRGYYDLNELNFRGVKNDAVSSIEFLRPGKIRIFVDGSFDGNYIDLTESVPDLYSIGYDDKISSVIVW